MIVPIVAARPMRGGPTVMPMMIRIESAPPVHSHTGSRTTSASPRRLCFAIRSAPRPNTSATIPEKASAGKTPTRSPNSPITAACTAPARPAAIASAMATAHAPGIPSGMGAFSSVW